MKQSKKIKQNQTGTENFDVCFCVIFDGFYQSFVRGRETGY